LAVVTAQIEERHTLIEQEKFKELSAATKRQVLGEESDDYCRSNFELAEIKFKL
jgi:hypothetical protein